jgi:hypothetical protein
MWNILRETNRSLFQDCESNVLCLKAFFFRFLLDLAIVCVPNFSLNILDLVNFCEDFSVSL